MFTKSESIQSLAAALAKAQAEFPAVPFNATNPFLKNKYADLGAVIETARPVLAKNGISFTQMPTSEAEYIGVTTVLMHASGEFVSSTIMLQAGEERGKSQAQVAGSVITYLRRYALASMLGLYADEDTDGQPHTPKPENVSRPEPEPKYTPVVKNTPDDAKPNVSQPTNGNGKVVRPMAPDYLKKKIADKAGKHIGEKVSEGLRGLMVGRLNGLFDGDENKRHQLTRFLTGYPSTKNMPDNLCKSIMDWIESDEEMARREAGNVIAHLDGENGQLKLA